jgi:hypothetical protein
VEVNEALLRAEIESQRAEIESLRTQMLQLEQQVMELRPKAETFDHFRRQLAGEIGEQRVAAWTQAPRIFGNLQYDLLTKAMGRIEVKFSLVQPMKKGGKIEGYMWHWHRIKRKQCEHLLLVGWLYTMTDSELKTFRNHAKHYRDEDADYVIFKIPQLEVEGLTKSNDIHLNVNPHASGNYNIRKQLYNKYQVTIDELNIMASGGKVANPVNEPDGRSTKANVTPSLF